MKDPAGGPTFREIPTDISVHDLTITHNYYDHSDIESPGTLIALDLSDSGDPSITPAA